jgi:hypothetical protein
MARNPTNQPPWETGRTIGTMVTNRNSGFALP